MEITRTVLCERPSLVTEQVFDPSKFLWECACADDRAWNLAIRHNLLRIYRFAHVQVNTETFDERLAIVINAEIRIKRGKTKTGMKRKNDMKMGDTPDRNDGRKENQESKHIDIPKSPEPIQRYKHYGERKRDRTKDLGRVIHH